MLQDLYDILGVPTHAGLKEVKAAFRMKAKANHPDLNPDDPEAERRFKIIAEAYEVLGNQKRRAQYDRWRTQQRHAPQSPPSSHTEVAQEFVRVFTEASHRAQTVFFDALLPRYLEIYGVGPGYQLVYHLAKDLEAETFMNMTDRSKPTFGTKQRIHNLLQRCPVHTDPGAKVGPMGGLVLGHLTSVNLRGITFHRVSLYAGSFFASGRKDVDGLSVALLKLLFREYTRYFERNLPEAMRPIHRKTLNPEAPLPFTANEAKWRDYGQVAGRAAKWGISGILLIITFQWLWGRLVY